jgi:hypothetical protein
MGEEQVRSDITKEEAARRQLETAIALFFCENDEISVHVLASSAAQILTDVCKAKNIVSFRDTFVDHIKPQYRSWAVPKLKEAYNFFKHADRDASGPLSRFHPGINGPLLFGCCEDYKNAFGDLPSVLHVFYVWTLAVKPEMIIFHGDSLKDQFLQAFAGLDRKPEAEQRREGRDLLQAYLLDRKEKLPLRAW